jgi:hypothetical protein
VSLCVNVSVTNNGADARMRCCRRLAAEAVYLAAKNGDEYGLKVRVLALLLSREFT